ncbi:hypothetical protein VTO58DRAFT_109534 [Aureobasidium pullulans]
MGWSSATKYINPHLEIYSKCVPNAPTSQSLLFNLFNQIEPEGPEMGQTMYGSVVIVLIDVEFGESAILNLET